MARGLTRKSYSYWSYEISESGFDVNRRELNDELRKAVEASEKEKMYIKL
jgi:hypothetical protein